MGYKGGFRVEWLSDFYNCDNCDNKERLEYAEISGRPWYDDPKLAMQHDWQVVHHLHRSELSHPLAFCSQSCMAEYMEKLVTGYYKVKIEAVG